MQVRPETGSIPDAPGCYLFHDADDRVLYVGKAKSLRHRLPAYWADPATLSPRTAQMVALAQRVEWVVVATEVDSLILEHSLIQRHQPRFNVRLKDDKSYPWLAVTVSEQWPRPLVYRGRKRKGVRYFGPYGHAKALRETLDLLIRSFPLRTCSDAKFGRHERLGRPCLLYDIERCSGPCIGAVEPHRYRQLVEELTGFLSGDTAAVVSRLSAEMTRAAEALEFERAARLRDRLAAVHKAIEAQQMVFERPEDLDVIGIAEDDLEAAIQVFHVRRGRVVGRSGLVADKVEDLSPGAFVERVLQDLYTSPGREVPRQVLLPRAPEDLVTMSRWLSSLRGGPVRLAVPKRGDKRALQEMVTRNASEDLARHRLRRAADHNARARALTELQQQLWLAQAPLRIECFDMSHLQGTDYVGSMVVFEDGLAKKSDYRRFRVRTVAGNDDYGAMEEVLTRRIANLIADREAQQVAREQAHQRFGGATVDDDVPIEEIGRRRSAHGRFSYAPNLMLLDGGKGQLAVGARVLERFGLTDEIGIAALAKQFEELFVPGSHDPIRIARGSEALYLLQRVRDEAHRFAVEYHRHRRGARMKASVLDTVPGLGPARRRRLLREVGSVRALTALSEEQLRAISWLPERVAEELFARLHGVTPEASHR